ncbi:4-hydroxy-3-methylbut-2-enyl diphosphate reductase [bacterium BMS3Abin14]|nr:4-hydroxy-3-methylbut-2-enyl diphosphate reductase [bacterium BMS3Abin14]
MSEIILAETAGFCFGVERAVEIAVSALEKGPKPVYTLGPIIHNPQEVQRLEAMGLLMAENLDDIERGTVIIRSHGAQKGVIEMARLKGLNVVDATCPFVNRLKERVETLAGENYQILIVGQADHPEVKAILSFAPADSLVAKSVQELKENPGIKSRVGIVAQTTHALENLQRVASYCVGICKEIKVFRTTCQTTDARRKQVRDMAGKVDVMIVVGGRNSANTARLTEAATEECPRTHQIESAEEIAALGIHPGSKVGVTAGASTPGWVIDDVVGTLKKSPG